MAISASIQALIAGEQVAGSRISRKMLEELMDEGLLSVVTRGSRKSYRARDIEALKRFLIDKDESYRMLDINASDSRASMAAETGNSKLVKVRSCPGFPVNTFEPITCKLNAIDIVINPVEGSFLFITDWKVFSIPEDVVVVGVENMENFRMIRQQRALFESEIGKHRFLFVSRYPQSTDTLGTVHRSLFRQTLKNDWQKDQMLVTTNNMRSIINFIVISTKYKIL